MNRVEIYYSKMCWACHEAMDYFEEHGIPYTSYEVRWQGEVLADGEYERELQKRLGHVEFVPQIFIDGQHIGGWMRMQERIELGELDHLLAP